MPYSILRVMNIYCEEVFRALVGMHIDAGASWGAGPRVALSLYGMLPQRGPIDPEDAALAEQQRVTQRQHAALLASL